MKQCSKCKEFKEEENFNKKNSSKDGLQSICKNCAKENYILRKEKVEKFVELEKVEKFVELVKIETITGKTLELKVAEYLGVSKQSVHNWIFKKQLSATATPGGRGKNYRNRD